MREEAYYLLDGGAILGGGGGGDKDGGIELIEEAFARRADDGFLDEVIRTYRRDHVCRRRSGSCG